MRLGERLVEAIIDGLAEVREMNKNEHEERKSLGRQEGPPTDPDRYGRVWACPRCGRGRSSAYCDASCDRSLP